MSAIAQLNFQIMHSIPFSIQITYTCFWALRNLQSFISGLWNIPEVELSKIRVRLGGNLVSGKTDRYTCNSVLQIFFAFSFHWRKQNKPNICFCNEYETPCLLYPTNMSTVPSMPISVSSSSLLTLMFVIILVLSRK